MHTTPITLKKISRLTGYSISTVSKALNNKEDISIQTRSFISKIAKKHNYVPNYYALALRKKQSKTLAVIIPEISDAFYSKPLSEIQKMSYDLGFRLLIFQSFNSIQYEKDCFNEINDGSVNGVLIITALDNHFLSGKLGTENLVPTVLWKLKEPHDQAALTIQNARKYFDKLILSMF